MFILSLCFGTYTFSQGVPDILRTIYQKDDYQQKLPGEVATIDTPKQSDPKFIHGKIDNVGGNWVKVLLENNYTSMVVVATPVVNKGGNTSVVTRIRNAAGNGFEVKIQSTSPRLLDQITVNYVVAEEGAYMNKMKNFKFEVRKDVSTFTASKGNWVTENREFFYDYSYPVVVGQVMTTNDTSWSVFWASGRNDGEKSPSGLGFAAGKHVGRDSNAVRANEMIGYMVFETNEGYIKYENYEAGFTTRTIKEIENKPEGSELSLVNIGSVSNLVVSSAGMADDNGGWPLLRKTDNGSYRFFITEDQILGTGSKHGSEDVAYIVFGKINPMDRKGLSPFETAYLILTQAGLLIGFIVFYSFLLEKLSVFSIAGFERAKTPKKQTEMEASISNMSAEERIRRWVSANNYLEAIHEMWIEIVKEIQYKLDTTISGAFTAREIVRYARLSAAAKEQIKIISDEVEKSFFGNKICQLEDYNKCLSAYKKFINICYNKRSEDGNLHQ